MQIRSVGIDLGKTTFHLVALSAAGKVLLRKKFTQKQLITFTANMQISFSPFGAWLDALELRAPINVVITAAANKLSRIAWAVLSSGQDYRPAVSPMPA